MYRTKRRFNDIKQPLQKVEGIIEVALLSVIYYAVWRNFYNVADFPTYYGNGKYLLMIVYAMLVIVLFRLGDGFKFGDLKLTDVFISQTVSLLLANAITYFQLCLIANQMVSSVPMIGLMLAEMILVALCTYSFTRIFQLLKFLLCMMYIKQRYISRLYVQKAQIYLIDIHKTKQTPVGFWFEIESVRGYGSIL